MKEISEKNASVIDHYSHVPYLSLCPLSLHPLHFLSGFSILPVFLLQCSAGRCLSAHAACQRMSAVPVARALAAVFNSPLTVDGPFYFITSTFTCYPLYILQCISSPSLPGCLLFDFLSVSSHRLALELLCHGNQMDKTPRSPVFVHQEVFQSNNNCPTMKTKSLCGFFSLLVCER